jgi:hypothetical protein
MCAHWIVHTWKGGGCVCNISVSQGSLPCVELSDSRLSVSEHMVALTIHKLRPYKQRPTEPVLSASKAAVSLGPLHCWALSLSPQTLTLYWPVCFELLPYVSIPWLTLLPTSQLLPATQVTFETLSYFWYSHSSDQLSGVRRNWSSTGSFWSPLLWIQFISISVLRLKFNKTQILASVWLVNWPFLP